MLDSVLRSILLPRHHDAGMFLAEGDDVLELRREKAVLARFSPTGATLKSLRDAADVWLKQFSDAAERGRNA